MTKKRRARFVASEKYIAAVQGACRPSPAKRNRTALDTAAVAAGRANQAPDEARSPAVTGAVSGASRQSLDIAYVVMDGDRIFLRVLTSGRASHQFELDEVGVSRLAAEAADAQFRLMLKAERLVVTGVWVKRKRT